MILLGGAKDDPNLECLSITANKNKIEVIDMRHDFLESPAMSWRPESNGCNFLPNNRDCIGAFIRYDFFSSLIDPSNRISARAQGWFHSVQGFLLSNLDVKIFNRNINQLALFKPAVLQRAATLGIDIPNTIFTNILEEISVLDKNEWIAKPIAGGDYCYLLEDAINVEPDNKGNFSMPGIVQEKLAQPEIRIYVVGDFSIAFEVESKSLDYRILQDANLSVATKNLKEIDYLKKLLSELGMDFGAADFKTDPKTGNLKFLELNTSPMFAKFDEVCGGKISEAMIFHLVSRPKTN